MRTLSVYDAPAVIEQEEDVMTENTGGDGTGENRRTADRNEASREKIPSAEDPIAGCAPEGKEAIHLAPV